MRRALPASLILAALSAGCAGRDPARPSPEWAAVPAPAAQGRTLRAVSFVDARTGFVVGDEGLCLKTDDGGDSWKTVPTGSKARLRDVRFKDARHGWICGDGDPDAPDVKDGHVMWSSEEGSRRTCGTLLTTADGGDTWSASWVSTSFELHAVEISESPLLQIGINGSESHRDGDILRSPDGGRTWGADRAFRALFDIRSLSNGRWIAVGSPVSAMFFPAPPSPLFKNRRTRILFSRDAGRTWDVSSGSDGRAPLRGAAARPDGISLAVGDGGSILRSVDAGQTWSVVEAGTAENLHAVAFSADAAVAVGTRGTLLWSEDLGMTWSPVPVPASADLLDAAVTETACFAVGGAGVIVRRFR